MKGESNLHRGIIMIKVDFESVITRDKKRSFVQVRNLNKYTKKDIAYYSTVYMHACTRKVDMTVVKLA